MSAAQAMEKMARLLASIECDLADEREVMRRLQEARFAHGDIVAHMDEAVERARAKRQRGASVRDVG